MHSAVLIVPTELKAQADAVGAAMGWGPVSYTIALGDGEAVTHFAARADVSGQFVRWVRGAEPLPDPAFEAVIEALTADFSPCAEDPSRPVMWGRAHLTAVLETMALEMMVSDADT